jgi:hypothetical protein
MGVSLCVLTSMHDAQLWVLVCGNIQGFDACRLGVVHNIYKLGTRSSQASPGRLEKRMVIQSTEVFFTVYWLAGVRSLGDSPLVMRSGGKTVGRL